MKILILLILTLVSFNLFAVDCIQTNAAFDIGSGTTKMKIAKVDICKHKIIKILFESNRSVEYKQALKESKSNILEERIIKVGIKKLLELKAEAKQFNPKSYLAVATSAFRTAVNGEKIAKQISKETGIFIKVISQEKEAEIGFVGASLGLESNLENYIVWDIGGGSMQMTTVNSQGKYSIYEGKLASVSFKNHIIEKIQKKNINKVKSPNPISKTEKNIAISYASEFARSTIPADIIAKLKKANTNIIGIGGVHYFSIAKKVSGSENYSLKMLEDQITKNLNRTDSELGDDEYVSTDTVNLILVAGFMKEFGIKEVKTKKINMTNGILIMPSLI